MYCQVDAVRGNCRRYFDKELWKSEGQNKLNVTTGTNWIGDCLLVGGWCLTTVALIS